METPVLSVIVPSHNLGEYLPETLDSVLAQTFQDWECIIVENGSTDNSPEIARAYCAKDVRFRLVKMDSAGVAAARNAGLSKASGRYILFLDADDLIAPHYMQDAVSALDSDPLLDLVYGGATRFGAEKSWDLPPFSMSTMLASNCLYISCFFRRKDAVTFDPAFKTGFEDWDYWLTFLEWLGHEPKVLCLPSLCFYYRTRRNSRNKGVSDEALASIRPMLWEKHKALYGKYFCNPCETVEYRRLQRSFRKASRWSLAWKLRMLYRKLAK
jgi:glycosyltransferase involved in cell wall biosynthesis